MRIGVIGCVQSNPFVALVATRHVLKALASACYIACRVACVHHATFIVMGVPHDEWPMAMPRAMRLLTSVGVPVVSSLMYFRPLIMLRLSLSSIRSIVQLCIISHRSYTVI